MALLHRVPLAVALPFVLAGPALAEGPPVQVVASFSILADMAARVGGDDVTVTALVGVDSDAHVYEPTPADVRTVAAADLLVVNGLGFETWLDRLVAASGFAGSTVVASQGVTPREFEGADEHHEADAHEEEEHQEGGAHHEEEHEHGALDPHAWQSLDNGVLYVRAIADALAAIDPDDAADYADRAGAYIGELRALDADLRTRLATVPDDRRTIVTSHDAFGYFADAYGLSFLAPEGVSTEADVSAADVARIVDQIREDRAAALFMENISDPRLLEQIAAESGAAIGGSLYSDALSGPEGEAGSYLDMMRVNAERVVSALALGG